MTAKRVLLIIAVTLCVSLSSSLTISRSREPQRSPSQFINPLSNKSSYYGTDNKNNNNGNEAPQEEEEEEEQHCPEQFSFDERLLKCKYGGAGESSDFMPLKQHELRCPEGFEGTLPNPANCRTFYNCVNGWKYEMTCPAHLLYSGRIPDCDWPLRANCCEFWEEDSGKLVADGVFT